MYGFHSVGSLHVFVLGPSEEDTYDVLADPPSDCDESALQIVFEGSQQPFLPIYFLQLDKMRQYVWVNWLYFSDVADFNSNTGYIGGGGGICSSVADLPSLIKIANGWLYVGQCIKKF